MQPGPASLLAGVLVASYLIGGIPWALIIGRAFYGIDPRTVGSGNLGATNVFRALGARAAIVTLLLDAAKGASAVLIARAVLLESFGAFHEWGPVLAMLAAVAGHTYSPYIGFKGGKGVATSAGALFVLTPIVAALMLLLFIIVVATTRMVSLGSIVIALAYAPLTWFFYPDETAVQVIVVVLVVLVLFNHRSNMVRILRGEENRVSFSGRGRGATETDEETR